jgi:hypothetical protein
MLCCAVRFGAPYRRGMLLVLVLDKGRLLILDKGRVLVLDKGRSKGAVERVMP